MYMYTQTIENIIEQIHTDVIKDHHSFVIHK